MTRISVNTVSKIAKNIFTVLLLMTFHHNNLQNEKHRNPGAVNLRKKKK
jgi:hypothetical protein